MELVLPLLLVSLWLSRVALGHVMEPTSEADGHDTHACCPTMGWNEPVAQGIHCIWPVCDWNEPAGQGAHVCWPTSAVAVPEGHGVQNICPARLL